MGCISLNHLTHNPKIRFIKKRAPKSFKEKIRYPRYLAFGMAEALKIADRDIRDYFFVLFCRALYSESQIIDLAALRRRAAELAAEGPPPPEPEAEPPVEVAPREPIPEGADGRRNPPRRA
jgi:hypothetical protein